MSDFREAINEASDAIHALAVEKGWYESERSPLEIHMLICTEVAEASEAVRSGLTGPQGVYWPAGPKGKPEGELIELADAVIRIMDYAASKRWDLGKAIQLKHEYNKTRPHRHGGKLY